MTQVVAVHRDVEGADRDHRTFDFGDQRGQTLGELNPAARDPDQDEVTRTPVVFEDFVGDAPQTAGDVLRAEHCPPRRVKGLLGRPHGVKRLLGMPSGVERLPSGPCDVGARHTRATSFPASPDRSLKDVYRGVNL